MNDIRRFISKEPLPIPKDTAVKRPSLDEMHSNVKQVRAAASHPLTDAIDKALRNDNRISTWEWTSRLDGIEPAMADDPLTFGFGGVGPLDIAKLESLLQRADQREIQLDRRVRKDIAKTIERYDRDLAKGKVKTGCFVNKRGYVHQKAVCEAAGITTNRFFEIMQPQAWSPNLVKPDGGAIFQRGEVRELDHFVKENGDEVFVQHERMLLGSGKTDMDMTKISTITVSTDPDTGLKTATVEWQVYRSDPTAETGNLDDTMVWDTGFIEFAPAQDGTGVRISFHNETSSNTELNRMLAFMPDAILDPVTAQFAGALGGDVVAGYRAIAQGQIEPVRFAYDNPTDRR